MLDDAQQKRIEAIRNRKDKPHLRIKESECYPGLYGLQHDNDVYLANRTQFLDRVSPQYYLTPGFAARAWHYPQER